MNKSIFSGVLGFDERGILAYCLGSADWINGRSPMKPQVDPSILANRSMWHIHGDYDTWISRVTQALGEHIRDAPDLVYLLSWGFETHPSSDYERRQRLFIYLSIAAGATISSRVEKPLAPYWHGRQMVEAEARKMLTKHFYSYPTTAEERVRNETNQAMKYVYRLGIRQFIDVIVDRDTLRLLFCIFDPETTIYRNWWLFVRDKNLTEEKRTATLFMDWLLRVMWSSGLRGKPELATWARRRTMSWLYHSRHLTRCLANIHPETWMHAYARKRAVEIRAHRHKRGIVRVTRTAIRDARGRRLREASFQKAMRRMFPRKVVVTPRKGWRTRVR